MSTVSIYRDTESSPTVVLYGDGGDHEVILRYLDGWYGSPESKVQLSERAYGNGAHDVAASDINYGARTVTIDWRILATERGRVLTLLYVIRSLAGHTVRVRVVDGSDDLYVVGYVQESAKDKAAQNIPQQTETGTLTIVCQRPELLSWRAQSAQLMPVARSRGGLSYGVQQYGLAWTGTADASTSTLSQDGSVVATNLVTDPNALTKHGIAIEVNGVWTSANPVADGEHWRVIIDPSWSAALYPAFFNAWRDTGDVVVITADANADKIWVENGTLISHTSTMAAYRIGASSLGNAGVWFVNSKSSMQSGEGITITGYGVYTNDDWQAMQALGVDWFIGSSQSPPANSGLSYGPGNKGLSYGVTADGGERNLAVLSNHGSYPAYPTLVVNGPFPDGVEIQTGVGGSIKYSGAVGMVPLTIQCDPRNVAASMGGVDVGRYLVGRDLPSIPSGGSLSLRLVTAGSGWVTCSVHDTYL